MFVINTKPYGWLDMWDGYYTGKTYELKGEVYAVCSRNIEDAKKYTSLKKAEKAAESLNNKACNYEFYVEK